MIQPLPIEGRDPLPGVTSGLPRTGSAQKEVARLLGKPVRHAPATLAEGPGNPPTGPQPAIVIARVLGLQADGRAMLRLLDGRVQVAALAASCLLRPGPGDLASLLVQGDSAWVTAVLERDPALPAQLDLGTSALEIRAHAITLQAEAELRATAHKLASHATVSVSTCGDRYAHVSGTDSSQARCTLIKSTGHMGLHAGDTAITAEALIKVDAGQVHMC
jgi:Protein of unknown function (DUF3540)